MEDIIFGRNPVLEALEAGRDINKLVILEGSRDKTLQKIISAAKSKRLVIQFSERKILDRIVEGETHQGVVAYVAAYSYFELEDILAVAKEKEEVPFVIICDEINDPHNLGSIIRTADAVGAHGVIIPKRRSAALNQTVAKTSCGAIEYVKVARVTNIATTIDKLKEMGFWIVGTDMSNQTYYEANLTGSIGVVVGNEGKGMSRLVKEKCDFVVSIPMKGHVDSLNASVASGIVMYEVLRQRTLPKK
ncbi:23S rRNA (guanosine(2251)-2'-O)-methyltransferase RlmB [Fusibacter ferrireducens]|uniref:23S rRNA (Guanosine(2251)-2'-O)-methyltransferase RlmB n=1 Tax=Fusibacter ferrireducens TaxID=2785058 RepID=A0ABS0A172_9FIRM|nr:23S rRNA (guanosine(2251)-2'-O)-methyltransferase RlmB [Fusibacter ferrireducens]MBF4695865.1 23S rRNA (guanosine(2251)-2'-O)-methyltransferase RlmB [Fusibacter ferrireducens]